MQAANVNGVPVFIVTQTGGFNQDKRLPYVNMKNRFAIILVVLGSLQIVLGILSIIFGAVNLEKLVNNMAYSYAFVGHGNWIGIIFIITGSFGIFGGMRKSRCSVITFNILSIISASFTAVMYIISIIEAEIGFKRHKYLRESMDSHYHYDNTTQNYDSYRSERQALAEQQKIVAIMDSLMAVVTGLEAIVAICSSVVCCKIGACCCDCDGLCWCPPDPPLNETGKDLLSPQQQTAILDLINQSQATMTNYQKLIFDQADTQQYQELQIQRNEDTLHTQSIEHNEPVAKLPNFYEEIAL